MVFLRNKNGVQSWFRSKSLDTSDKDSLHETRYNDDDQNDNKKDEAYVCTTPSLRRQNDIIISSTSCNERLNAENKVLMNDQSENLVSLKIVPAQKKDEGESSTSLTSHVRPPTTSRPNMSNYRQPSLMDCMDAYGSRSNHSALGNRRKDMFRHKQSSCGNLNLSSSKQMSLFNKEDNVSSLSKSSRGDSTSIISDRQSRRRQNQSHEGKQLESQKDTSKIKMSSNDIVDSDTVTTNILKQVDVAIELLKTNHKNIHQTTMSEHQPNLMDSIKQSMNRSSGNNNRNSILFHKQSSCGNLGDFASKNPIIANISQKKYLVDKSHEVAPIQKKRDNITASTLRDDGNTSMLFQSVVDTLGIKVDQISSQSKKKYSDNTNNNDVKDRKKYLHKSNSMIMSRSSVINKDKNNSVQKMNMSDHTCSSSNLSNKDISYSQLEGSMNSTELRKPTMEDCMDAYFSPKRVAGGRSKLKLNSKLNASAML